MEWENLGRKRRRVEEVIWSHIHKEKTCESGTLSEEKLYRHSHDEF